MTQEWHYMAPPPRFESVTAEGKKKVEKCHHFVYGESKSIDLGFTVNKCR